MPMYTCPHCKQPTVTLKQKYLAGKWIDVHCSGCGGRSCQYPVLMAVLYFLYIWDLMLFGYVAYLKQSWEYVVVTLVGILVLDAISLYIPLAAMKRNAGSSAPSS